jgi:dCMP deaminase
MDRPDLDTWALDLCDLVARRSRDPSTRVGAVILRPDKTIASVGYNGFPRGTNDNPTLYAERPVKLLRTVHAEANAIVTAREPLHGCTTYVSPLHPCATCAGLIIQAGIRTVRYRAPAETPFAWHESFGQAMDLLREAGVEVYRIPLASGA